MLGDPGRGGDRMTEALPAPLTPADCDLRGLQFMPLDVQRLLDSDMFALATGDEFKAAFVLWAKAWWQAPAASLPDDERILARLAAVSLSEWRALMPMALRGWIRCRDGRLYHPVVAEKALESWIERLLFRKRSAVGNSKRYKRDFNISDIEAQILEARRYQRALTGSSDPDLPQGGEAAPTRSDPTSFGDPTRTENRSEGTETGTGNNPPDRAAPVNGSPNALAWTRGVALLTSAGRMPEGQARSFFGLLLKGPPALEARELLAVIASAEANSTQDPQAYLTKAAHAIRERRGATSGPVIAAWDEATWRTACANFRCDGAWSAEMGPEPGKPGCIVPGGVLDEFGWAA